MRRSGCRLLFTVSGFLDTDYPAMLAGQELPALQDVILLRGASEDGVPLERFLARGEPIADAEVSGRLQGLSPTDLCDIMYTSGTTGAPKGVMSAHGQVVAIFDAWSSAVGLTAADRYLIVNPFFHTFGYKSGKLSRVHPEMVLAIPFFRLGWGDDPEVECVAIIPRAPMALRPSSVG